VEYLGGVIERRPLVKRSGGRRLLGGGQAGGEESAFVRDASVFSGSKLGRWCGHVCGPVFMSWIVVWIGFGG
jgi:hypothetical protein